MPPCHHATMATSFNQSVSRVLLHLPPVIAGIFLCFFSLNSPPLCPFFPSLWTDSGDYPGTCNPIIHCLPDFFFFFPLDNQTNPPKSQPGSDRSHKLQITTLFPSTSTSADTGSPVLCLLLDLEVLWDSELPGGSGRQQQRDRTV